QLIVGIDKDQPSPTRRCYAVIAGRSHPTIVRSHTQRHHATRDLVSVTTVQQLHCSIARRIVNYYQLCVPYGTNKSQRTIERAHDHAAPIEGWSYNRVCHHVASQSWRSTSDPASFLRTRRPAHEAA